MPLNGRAAERRTVTLRTWITARDLPEAVACSLSDVSETGARIVVADGSRIPEVFELRMTRDGRVMRRCRIIWRRERVVGVRFVGGDTVWI
jgi:PilZ domain